MGLDHQLRPQQYFLDLVFKIYLITISSFLFRATEKNLISQLSFVKYKYLIFL